MTTKPPLPSKENALFRSIVKFYETKQYKKGLKAADQVLKKFPEHGETLAMKGLTLNCMNRKEEAYEYVRKGLKYDLRSHVCWHVYGLLYRSDQDYAEAIKCYRNALRIDPDNLQILRDLYLLQIQTRDLKGYAEIRRTMLTLKPNNRLNWIGFAVSHHLNGNLQMGVDIIDKYISTLDPLRPITYEDSEMVLYQNLMVYEQGDVQAALDHLEKCTDQIVDRTLFKQKRAEYLIQLGRFDEAKVLCEELLEFNANNYTYQRSMQCCLLQDASYLVNGKGMELPSDDPDLSQEKINRLLQFYDKNAELDPKNLLLQRIPLNCTNGADFEFRINLYMRQQLRRGVPFLGADLKLFYNDNDKVQLIEKLILSYVQELEKEELKESPMMLLWTYYLIAQHFDRLKKFSLAIEYIDKCIEHTPTILDFYQRKGRILKHAGDLNSAADFANEGRLLDLADRYINNKTTEYLLHADRMKEADETIALFTRHEGDPQQNLFDMQCMWYEIECGESFLRTKQYGKALKKFFAVEKHFNDIHEDQFDFHTYCIRKMTMRAYIQMLRMTDTLYGHEYFQQAAHGAIKSYLAIYDEKNAVAKNDLAATDLTQLSSAERKKLKRAQAKARKAEFKKKEEAQLKLLQEAEERERELSNSAKDSKSKKQNKRHPAPVDDDPFGEKLAAKDPLTEAWRFVSILQQHCPKDLWTHFHAFDVALRKRKYILCLEALNRAKELCSTINHEAELTYRIIQLFKHLETVNNDSIHAVVQEILTEEKKLLLEDHSTLSEYFAAKLVRLQETIHGRFFAAKSLLLLDKKANYTQAVELLLCLTDPNLESCESIHSFLQCELNDAPMAKKYQEQCLQLFQYSSYFGPGYAA